MKYIEHAHFYCCRGREGHGAMNKVKSNLLAASLIVTTVPSNIKLSEAVVEQICYQVSHSLDGPLEVRKAVLLSGGTERS
jgi:hypothetical protein